MLWVCGTVDVLSVDERSCSSTIKHIFYFPQISGSSELMHLTWWSPDQTTIKTTLNSVWSFRALGLYWEIELELSRKFLLGVESIGEVDAPDTTIGVDLNTSIDQSIDRSSNQSINRSIDQSIHQSIDQSIDRSINQSIDQSINLSINQSIYQSINQSINRSIIQSINQLINQSIDRSINRSVYQSINQSIYQSINRSIYQSINQSINQSIYLSVKQSTILIDGYSNGPACVPLKSALSRGRMQTPI